MISRLDRKRVISNRRINRWCGGVAALARARPRGHTAANPSSASCPLMPRPLAAGGRDNGGPGYRDDAPGYYAAFVLDPGRQLSSASRSSECYWTEITLRSLASPRSPATANLTNT